MNTYMSILAATLMTVLTLGASVAVTVGVIAMIRGLRK